MNCTSTDHRSTCSIDYSAVVHARCTCKSQEDKNVDLEGLSSDFTINSYFTYTFPSFVHYIVLILYNMHIVSAKNITFADR